MAVIISNENFTVPNLEKRSGNDIDVANFKGLLKTLGFEVKVHNDITVKRMKEVIEEGYLYYNLVLMFFTFNVGNNYYKYNYYNIIYINYILIYIIIINYILIIY